MCPLPRGGGSVSITSIQLNINQRYTSPHIIPQYTPQFQTISHTSRRQVQLKPQSLYIHRHPTGPRLKPNTTIRQNTNQPLQHHRDNTSQQHTVHNETSLRKLFQLNDSTITRHQPTSQRQSIQRFILNSPQHNQPHHTTKGARRKRKRYRHHQFIQSIHRITQRLKPSQLTQLIHDVTNTQPTNHISHTTNRRTRKRATTSPQP